MIAESCSGSAQGDNLGVRGRIRIGDVAIPSAAHDAISAHDYRSDGNFSGFESALCGAEGFLHPEFVGTGR
jgi:hypothetical protein